MIVLMIKNICVILITPIKHLLNTYFNYFLKTKLLTHLKTFKKTIFYFI